MKHYFLSKLSDLNYRMAIHEGDANRRLASEIDKLLLLRGAPIPQRFGARFAKFQSLIDEALAGRSGLAVRPPKFRAIQCRTAAKYIAMLIAIENEWRE